MAASYPRSDHDANRANALSAAPRLRQACYLESVKAELPDIPPPSGSSEAALIVVDMQNDFAHQGGSPFVPEDAVSALTPFDQASALRQVTFLYQGQGTTAGLSCA